MRFPFDKPLARTMALGLALGLVTPTVHAGGITAHLAAAYHAIEHVEDPDLANLLSQEQQGYYGMGALFPDTFGYPPIKFYWFDYALDVGHLMLLPNEYGADLSQRLNQFPDAASALANPEFAGLISHYMGVIAHLVTDKHFDHYFMMRVDNQCGFYDGGSTDPGIGISNCGSQSFTDYWLDSGMANKEMTGVGWDASIRPVWAAVPASILPIMDAAFSDQAPFDSGVADAVVANWFQVLDEYTGDGPFFATPEVSLAASKGKCLWAVDNVKSNFGGVLDSGAVVAGYINRIWDILEAGGVPHFEESPLWNNPKSPNAPVLTDLTVPAEQRWHHDFASWITFPHWTGVSRFRFAHVKIGGGLEELVTVTLRDADGLDGLLGVYRSEFYDANVPELVLAQDVTAFRVSETRIAALVGEGPATEGYELRVMDLTAGLPSPWVSVDDGVTAFELEGTRIAYLKRAGGKASKRRKLMVLDGWLLAPPVTLAKGRIGALRLDGDRIAVLKKGKKKDRLLVRDGVGSPKGWFTALQHPEISDVQIDAGRIGVLLEDGGEFLLKEATVASDLKADWIVWESQGLFFDELVLQQGWIGAVHGGALLTKEGPAQGFSVAGPGDSLVHFGPPPDPGEHPTWMAVDPAGLLHEGVLDETLAYPVGLPDRGVIRQVDIATEPVPVPNWNSRAMKRYGVLVGDKLYVKSRCWIVDSAP